MDVHAAIESRRATRSLDRVDIPPGLVRDLASHARLSPSCSNNQPWRFVFVTGAEKLEALGGEDNLRTAALMRATI